MLEEMSSKLTPTNRPSRTSSSICLLGLGSQHILDKTNRIRLQSFFEASYGAIENITMEANRTFVSFQKEEDAIKAKQDLHGTILPEGLSTHKVTIHFAVPITPRKQQLSPEPGCTSLTAKVDIPGLGLIYDFLTIEEERELLTYFDAQPYDINAVSRRTQHYGQKIDFRSRGLLDPSTDADITAPPVPHLCLPILERAVQVHQHQQRQEGKDGRKESNPVVQHYHHQPDQLTINEYSPGQGISGHVDVHSLFHDVFYIISLSSGCVMDFRQMPSTSRNTSTPSPLLHKALWLPPRSLLILKGEARYAWSHGINSRKTDKVDGKLLPRGRRVSLSFRRVNQEGQCHCQYPAQCDSRGVDVGKADLVERTNGLSFSINSSSSSSRRGEESNANEKRVGYRDANEIP